MPSSSSMVVWAAWFAFVILSFGAYEWYCIRHNKMTLSRTVWVSSESFPLLPPILSLVVGGLMVHFFWEGGYCAPGTPTLSWLWNLIG